MGEALKKFGIYDFMGIWGPGALTVAYYSFTLGKQIQMFLNHSDIVELSMSERYTFLLLYTAVAYTIGIILHELGKILKLIMNKCWHEKSEKYTDEEFGIAARYLKYTKEVDTHQYDTYHSVYALARSMSFSFLLHLCTILVFAVAKSIGICALIFWVFADIFLASLFYYRAYKYYKMWIKHTFFQYNFYTRQKGDLQNEINKTTKINM